MNFFEQRYGPGPLLEVQRKWMIFMNPPDHTRLRTLVNKAFTPRVVEGMRPRIAEIANSLLDRIDGASFDVMTKFAFPLPVTVISDLLGFSGERGDDFRERSRAIAAAIDLVVTPQVIDRANKAVLETLEYVAKEIEERRVRPKPDLMSALVAAEEGGDQLTADELVGTIHLLFGAGHETTVNLIGNGLLALLRNPDQLATLRANPDAVDSAVEELLRYDSSVQATARTAVDEAEILGKQIPKGDLLVAMIGSANRDPDEFHDPDRLDIDRSPNRHLSFGGGIHFCLGASLARLEARIAIMAVLRRFPSLALNGEPEWRKTFALRGLKTLPVTC